MSSSASAHDVHLDNTEKWEHCIENTLRKATIGFVASAVLSLVFRRFGSKIATVAMGTGIGIGCGYTECKLSFEQDVHFQKKFVVDVEVLPEENQKI